MATVINNPPAQPPLESETNSWIGLVLMIFIVFLLLYLGVPWMRGLNQYRAPVDMTAPVVMPTDSAEQTQEPSDPTAAPQPTTERDDTTIIIPDRIDVNINQTSPSPTQ